MPDSREPKPWGCGKFGCFLGFIVALVVAINNFASNLQNSHSQPSPATTPASEITPRVSKPSPEIPATLDSALMSGGLGLFKDEVDARWGKGIYDGIGFKYKNDQLFMQFDGISHIEYSFNPPVRESTARSFAFKFLPFDKRIVKDSFDTSVYPRTIILGTSKWLSNRYPNTKGDFIVIIRQADGKNKVTSIVIGDGHNP